MTCFVVYHTPHTRPGYFLMGKDGDIGGTYRVSQASQFKTKADAEKVARAYGAIGTECQVLRRTAEN